MYIRNTINLYIYIHTYIYIYAYTYMYIEYVLYYTSFIIRNVDGTWSTHGLEVRQSLVLEACGRGDKASGPSPDHLQGLGAILSRHLSGSTKGVCNKEMRLARYCRKSQTPLLQAPFRKPGHLQHRLPGGSEILFLHRQKPGLSQGQS